MKRTHASYAALLVACMASPALANAGTPLMWAGMLHIFLGNALIGLIEGLIIAWMFARTKRSCIRWMIVANYGSALVGYVGVVAMSGMSLPVDVHTARQWILLMTGVAFVVTVIFEWPFVARCRRGTGASWWTSLKGSVVANIVTYTGLIGWYWLASGASLYSDVRIIAARDMKLPPNIALYYIGKADGDVYRIMLPAAQSEHVARLGAMQPNDHLYAVASPLRQGAWDLYAQTSNGAVQIGQVPGADAVPVPDSPSYQRFWHTGILGTARQGVWEFHAGMYAIEGLHGRHKGNSQEVWLSVETPFVAWRVRNVIQLPGDYIIFQFGNDQICILEPQTRKLALLARGSGPVAVLKEPADTEPAD